MGRPQASVNLQPRTHLPLVELKAVFRSLPRPTRESIHPAGAGFSRFSSLALGSPEKRTRHLISTSSISNSNLPGSCACAKAIPRISLPSVLNAAHGNEYCFRWPHGELHNCWHLTGIGFCLHRHGVALAIAFGPERKHFLAR